MGLLDAVALAVDPEDGAEAEAIALNARYGALDARDAIALAANELYPGRIALVSSFGAESAVLLHLLSEVDRGVPVIFLDTGRLFAETLEYRTRLVAHLGLTDVRSVTPDPERLHATDPHRALWMTDPDLCCRIRKTEPLARALARLRRLVHRPQALPERDTRRPAACSRPTASASRSTRWPTGAPTTSRPTWSGTTCRPIRWSSAAIPRSAASPAPAAWRRARTLAPAAGAGRTRPSAASTPASKPTAAGSDHASVEERRASSNDDWTIVADGEPLPEDGKAIVSLKRWREERAALAGRAAPLGLLIEPGNTWADIAADLGALSRDRGDDPEISPTAAPSPSRGCCASATATTARSAPSAPTSSTRCR